MAGKDRQTCLNVAVEPDLEHAHMHTCREMRGGGGHLMGAPTNWKEGF